MSTFAKTLVKAAIRTAISAAAATISKSIK